MKRSISTLSIFVTLFAGNFANADLPPINTQQKCVCSFEGVKVTEESYQYYRSQGEFSTSYWRRYFSSYQNWDNESESYEKFAYISSVKLRKYVVFMNVDRKPQLLAEEISSFIANDGQKKSAMALCNADIQQLKISGICE